MVCRSREESSRAARALRGTSSVRLRLPVRRAQAAPSPHRALARLRRLNEDQMAEGRGVGRAHAICMSHDLLSVGLLRARPKYPRSNIAKYANGFMRLSWWPDPPRRARLCERRRCAWFTEMLPCELCRSEYVEPAPSTNEHHESRQRAELSGAGNSARSLPCVGRRGTQARRRRGGVPQEAAARSEASNQDSESFVGEQEQAPEVEATHV